MRVALKIDPRPPHLPLGDVALALPHQPLQSRAPHPRAGKEPPAGMASDRLEHELMPVLDDGVEVVGPEQVGLGDVPAQDFPLAGLDAEFPVP